MAPKDEPNNETEGQEEAEPSVKEDDQPSHETDPEDEESELDPENMGSDGELYKKLLKDVAI